MLHRILAFSILAALAVVSWYHFVATSRDEPMADLAAYAAAGSRLAQGLDIYRHVYDGEIATLVLGDSNPRGGTFTMYYRYPPFWAWIFSEFRYVPFEALKHAWLVINYLTLLGAIALTPRIIAPKTPPLVAAVVTAILFLLFIPTMGSFSEGQVDLLVLLLCLAFIASMRREQRVLAGLFLGLATSIKIVPAILILPSLVKGDLRPTLGALLFGCTWIVLMSASSQTASWTPFFFATHEIVGGALESTLLGNMSIDLVFTALGLEEMRALAIILKCLTLLIAGVVAYARLKEGHEVTGYAILMSMMLLLSSTLFWHHLVWALPLIAIFLLGDASHRRPLGIAAFFLLSLSQLLYHGAYRSYGAPGAALVSLIVLGALMMLVIATSTGTTPREE